MTGRKRGIVRNGALALCLSILAAGCSGGDDFSGTGTMTAPRHGHTATLLDAGRIFIAAGLTKTDPLGSAEFYGAAEGRFMALPTPGLRPRGWHRAARLPGGGVLLTGGWTHGNIALREAAILPPSGGAFARTDMNAARFDHTLTALKDGSYLVTGGNDGKRAIRGMEIFSPHEKSFAPAARPMFIARQQHTATLLPDGSVLIAGGGRGKGARYAEIYDAASRRTGLARKALSTPRSRHTATLLRGGKVLIAGGLGPAGPLATAELYDPVSSSFELIKEKFSAARQQHTATLLPDGRVLLLGGWGGEKSLAGGEIFDPEGRCFRPLGSSMRYERRLHTATPLPGGRVLIAGGASDIDVLASAEIFKAPPRGEGCGK